MQENRISKIERATGRSMADLMSFLAITPVLIEHIGMPDDDTMIAKESRRRKEILAGAPLSEAEHLHHRLSVEFETRLNALDNGYIYIVADFTRDDLSSPEAIAGTINGRYAKYAPPDDPGRISEETAIDLHESEASFCTQLMPLDFDDDLMHPTRLVIPEMISLSLEENISDRILAPFSVCPLIPHEVFCRLSLHHEGSGHGTDENFIQHFRHDAANDELRADIASLIGTIRDTGDFAAAKTCIFARDLAALRTTAFEGKTTHDTTKYAIGPELRRAFNRISKTPDIRNLCDRGIIALTDQVFSSLKFDKGSYSARQSALRNAWKLICDTKNGSRDTLERLAPERLASATDILENCMEAHGFFFTPEAPRPKPATPAPRPW